MVCLCIPSLILSVFLYVCRCVYVYVCIYVCVYARVQTANKQLTASRPEVASVKQRAEVINRTSNNTQCVESARSLDNKYRTLINNVQVCRRVTIAFILVRLSLLVALSLSLSFSHSRLFSF